MGLAHYYRKVITQLKDFDDIKFYHVLRDLNQMADYEANTGVSLNKGVLLVNGSEKQEPIP